jgi:hypothetical protein
LHNWALEISWNEQQCAEPAAFNASVYIHSRCCIPRTVPFLSIHSLTINSHEGWGEGQIRMISQMLFASSYPQSISHIRAVFAEDRKYAHHDSEISAREGPAGLLLTWTLRSLPAANFWRMAFCSEGCALSVQTSPHMCAKAGSRMGHPSFLNMGRNQRHTSSATVKNILASSWSTASSPKIKVNSPLTRVVTSF